MHIKKSSLVSIAAMVAITIPLSSCVENNVDMPKILKAMQQDSRFRGPEGPRGGEGRKKEKTLTNPYNIKENTQLPNELTDQNSTDTKNKQETKQLQT